ncbi:MAG: PAS domain S-box protein, partial [Chlorobia bacterium]|nr:PAS domain S-box protein [Fimbriimonadaceae bacterium]
MPEQHFLSEHAAIVELALDAVVSMDSHGLVQAWNSMAETSFGWSKEEAIGEVLANLIIPEESRTSHFAGLAHFLSTGEGPILGKRLEVEAIHRNGQRFPIELAISPHRRETGVYFTAFIRDIRERKLAEKTLEDTALELDQRVRQRTAELEANNKQLELAEQDARKGRQELQDYIDSMTTLNAKVSVEGIVMLANKAAQIGSGLPTEQLIGSKFLQMEWCSFDPDVQLRVADAFDRARNGQTIMYEESVVLQGVATTISFNLVPIKDADGKVQYVVAEGRDISERKAVEDELREKTLLLESSNRELEAFSYSVSHDLRG